ncbi:MAG TPA: substrate-binding domain-containing protein [Streptosporangiaceae bacterium]|nr:substrate-binding domain-containing protein [Streptosporangiaceae bacterium]
MRKHVHAVAVIAAAGAMSLAGTAQAQAISPTPRGHARTPLRIELQHVTVPAGIEMAPAHAKIVGGVPPYTAQQPVCNPPVPNGVWSRETGSEGQTLTGGGVWESPPGNFTCTVTASDSAGNTASAEKNVPAVLLSPTAVVGVGSGTTQWVLDQFSVSFNAAKPASPLYGWDATNPVTGQAGDPIVTKNGCNPVARPDGSSAGITALTTENATTGGQPCMDYARSSRPRTSTDPASVSFLNLARDAVTYATQAKTNAPPNLTTADLTAIYNCAVTNWDQVGGKNAPIDAFIPQPASGVRASFLSAVGLAGPGPCVSDDNGNLAENEGVNPVLNDPNAIVPFSVGAWLSQKFRDAKCVATGCAFVDGVACIPQPASNLFGCAEDGSLVLHEVNSTAPTAPFPPTKSSVTSPAFTATFQYLLYDVVQAPEGTQPTGPLEALFGPAGWACTNSTARSALLHYGFEVLPTGTAAGDCGFAS